MAKWDLGKLKQPSPEAIVRAALERAVTCCEDELRNTAMLLSNPPKSSAAWDAANSIRKLADNPAEVAAIISAAAQLNKAGDGNKAVRDAHKQRDEEDRG